MATTQLAHSFAFMATVSLLIKLMLVTLQSCGRAMFRLVVWLGFDAVAKLISPSGLNTDLLILNVEALCRDLMLRPFGSVKSYFGYVKH